MLRSLVGSEMCIRDSHRHDPDRAGGSPQTATPRPTLPLRAPARRSVLGRRAEQPRARPTERHTCLLYTSDAADEEDSVDLGGHRIIKKKKKKQKERRRS